jgi:hypothetical protein
MGNEFGDAIDAIEEAVVGMAVEVCEWAGAGIGGGECSGGCNGICHED